MRRILWLLVLLGLGWYALRRRQATPLAPRDRAPGDPASGTLTSALERPAVTPLRVATPAIATSAPAPLPTAATPLVPPTSADRSVTQSSPTEIAADTNEADRAPDTTLVGELSPVVDPAPVEIRGSVMPVDGACPAGYPIKGNKSSGGDKIYHVKGGDFYTKVKPEVCFATHEDAEDAGYRRSRR